MKNLTVFEDDPLYAKSTVMPVSVMTPSGIMNCALKKEYQE